MGEGGAAGMEMPRDSPWGRMQLTSALGAGGSLLPGYLHPRLCPGRAPWLLPLGSASCSSTHQHQNH